MSKGMNCCPSMNVREGSILLCFDKLNSFDIRFHFLVLSRLYDFKCETRGLHMNVSSVQSIDGLSVLGAQMITDRPQLRTALDLGCQGAAATNGARQLHPSI
jgi:hypothetical protein